MAVSTESIKKLRESTGAGMLDCKKALEQADGDVNKAYDWLREKGLAAAAKRADRKASEGVVELYSHGNGRVGVMVEVNCETDFVARSEGFRTFAHELALQIAASSPLYVSETDIKKPNGDLNIYTPEILVQYFAESKGLYNNYIETHAPLMRRKSFDKWGDKFIAFRSVMQVVN